MQAVCLHRPSRRRPEPVSNTAILRIVRGGPGLAEEVETFRVPYETGASVLDGLIWLREKPRPVARLPLQLHERERLQGMHDADRWRDPLTPARPASSPAP